jgi:hypothetical protein
MAGQDMSLKLQASAVPGDLMARAIARLRERGIKPVNQSGFVRAAIALTAGCTTEEISREAHAKMGNRPGKVVSFDEFVASLENEPPSALATDRQLSLHHNHSAGVTINMMNNRLSAMEPRATSPGRSQRYTGPVPQTTLIAIPAQQHVTSTGALVQANIYWTIKGKQPPSPVVKRTAKHTSHPNPDLGSDAQAAAAANATPSQHYAQSGITGIDRGTQGRGGAVPVLAVNEIRFTANPVPSLSQLDVIGQSKSMGTMLAPVMGSASLVPPKRLPHWLTGTREC